MKPRNRFWAFLAAVYLALVVLFAGGGGWLLGELSEPRAQVTLLAFLLIGGFVLVKYLA